MGAAGKETASECHVSERRRQVARKWCLGLQAGRGDAGREKRAPPAWAVSSGHHHLTCSKSGELQIPLWSFPRRTRAPCNESHAHSHYG